MQQATLIKAAATLAYGSVLINTMPIWLVSIAAKSNGSEEMSGVLASVVLLAAAVGCGFGSRMVRKSFVVISAITVFVAPALTVIAASIAPAVLLCAGTLFGLAFGLLLHLSLRVLLAVDHPARAIGDTLAGALAVSLAVLLIVTAFPDTIMPILAALSLIPVAVVITGEARSRKGPAGVAFRWPDLRSMGFLAFFIAMGAYWAFLEVYAVQRALGSISGWLFAGLLTSAVGSAIAARVLSKDQQRVMLLSMLASAVSGGTTYAFDAPWIVGTSILGNGFFLFLFFPLYLGGAKVGEAGMRMALYLAGFALGGFVGAMILAFGSFSVLALAIAISGLVAMPSALSAQTPKGS